MYLLAYGNLPITSFRGDSSSLGSTIVPSPSLAVSLLDEAGFVVFTRLLITMRAHVCAVSLFVRVDYLSTTIIDFHTTPYSVTTI